MIAAAIATSDENPELAAKTIKRASNGLPHALHVYGPHGIYPEGSSYWDYKKHLPLFFLKNKAHKEHLFF